MSNTYTDQTTTAPILNYYKTESELTGQANPSVTELHMVPLTDTVVENYSSANNGYRVWASGLIEQWGWGSGVTYASGQGVAGTVNLPKAFSDNTYAVVTAMSTASYGNAMGVATRTTTTFTWDKSTYSGSGQSGCFYWYACGY